jgi:hypothetical protein
MSVREPLRIRKALLAGAVALALTGTGVAIAWSADSPSPSPSDSASGKANGQDKAKDKAAKAQHVHSESVVKKSDGTFETVLVQQGTVDAVSESSVTVKSEDGFTQSYAINADTRIVKVPAPAADGSPAKGEDGKRLKPSDATIKDIATGDSVRVSGVKNGSDVTARRLVDGATAGPGNGLGLGRGLGLGKGHGHGQGKPKDG